MGCACGSKSTRSAVGAQQAAAQSSRSAYVYEVTYNDSTTRRFNTESEAIAALSSKGGGYRVIPA
jgi:hypothetical protein